MLMRVADWHGEQAANYYNLWSKSNNDNDLKNYVRHCIIAKNMWNWQRRLQRINA